MDSRSTCLYIQRSYAYLFHTFFLVCLYVTEPVLYWPLLKIQRGQWPDLPSKSLRAVLHLAWRWDWSMLIKIGHAASIYSLRGWQRCYTAREENRWICLSVCLFVHHLLPAGRLDQRCEKEERKQDMSAPLLPLHRGHTLSWAHRLSVQLIILATASTGIHFFFKSNR